ncbi:ABC transporter [Afipia sp. P52-10]|uniref:ABC transporter ATP-binding protein n=1 Tax=Afipia sp. P52-10 TaxID=1429916 RepID=UPI0003DF3756|nr:ABC transporter ATP-binding protein [Afipia sp. P52-10]ETR78076.1 ABC transporter [Afipia sp. P52-10]
MMPLLDATGVTVRFGGLTALSDVTFQISPGEIVGLIGPNGAGKTTLFSSLVGLTRLSEGAIVFDREPVNGLRPHLIARRGMTKTFQNTALFPGMSLRDNVVIGALARASLAEAKEFADECLDKVGLLKDADVGVDNLTFPQKALGEVARALATRPRLVLLDEVMAALTPSEMTTIMRSLRALRDRDGITFMIVEHHMRAIMELSERILVLNFGKLIANGTPEQVSADPSVITAYLGSANAAH